jgi:ATP-binding cassette subfamily B protein
MKELRKLVPYIKPYWAQSLLALALITGGVFMDLTIPRLVQQIIDEGITAGAMPVVTNTTLLMLGISALSTLFAIGNNLLSVQVGEAFGRDLRDALFIKIQSFSFGNLDRHRTGRLMVRLTSDITMLQRLARMSLRIGTRAPLLLVGSFILMVSADTRLTLTLTPLLLLTGIIIGVLVTRLGPLFLEVQSKLDRLNNVLQENIAGVRVVKAFVRARHENDLFEGANQDFTEMNITVMKVHALVFPIVMALINVGVVLIIWSGGVQAINGDLTLGEIVAFSNYLLTAMTPLMIMAMLAVILASGIASAERVNEILEETPEVVDPAGARDLPDPVQGRVRFENVSFSYNGASDEPVLEDIDLVAEPGETIAVLGATGAGKTTLVHLIPRFYDVTAGRVTVDGVDVREVRQDSLRAHIGIVPQESLLFSGTVRDNIRYGKPDAGEEEVRAAARAAQAHDFITALPEGYDTNVAARGVNLSGGQKQRLAIARALLTQPRILILDDSTSSVDVETETEIQTALETLMQNRTSFVVAQRISTVLNADRIVVLEQGRVAAEGTHTALMASSPIYREIYDSQLGDGVRLAGLAEGRAP